MLEKVTRLDDGTILGFWQITETKEELLSELIGSEELLPQLQDFKSHKREMEFLSVRLLLQKIFSERVAVEYDMEGKPFLSGKEYNISITHTGDYVGVILHSSRYVGIDIERFRDKILRVKDRFLTDFEQAFVETKMQLQQMTIMWCVKEALYKMLGDSKIDLKNEVQIQPFVPYIEGILEAEYKDKIYEVKYQLDHIKCVAWCVD